VADRGQALLHGRSGELAGLRLDSGRHVQEREREIRLLQGLEAFCAGIRDTLLDPPFEIRQKVLRLVLDRVILADDKVVVRHIVPMTPIGLQPYPGPPQELPRRGTGDEARGRAVALHPAPAWPLAQQPGRDRPIANLIIQDIHPDPA
jgi:hypothetical protein